MMEVVVQLLGTGLMALLWGMFLGLLRLKDHIRDAEDVWREEYVGLLVRVMKLEGRAREGDGPDAELREQ